MQLLPQLERFFFPFLVRRSDMRLDAHGGSDFKEETWFISFGT
jgi:hypothetical protein